MEKIDFMPVNVVRMTYKDPKADPKGYIIMPVTYNKNVYGPFCIMIKCKELGIEKCYVNSYDWRRKFYNSVGFITEDTIGIYHKKI